MRNNLSFISQRELNTEAFTTVVSIAQEHKSSSIRLSGETYSTRMYANIYDRGLVDPRIAFDEVVPAYQDRASGTGYIRAVDYGKLENKGGRATHTGNTFKVKATTSDFVCDVEIAARRSLSQSELGYFKKYYLQQYLSIADPDDKQDWYQGADKYLLAHLLTFDENSRETVAEFDQNLREKLGAEFIRVGLNPVSKYFEDPDVRMKRELQYA
jgi:hypothetical protein